MLEADELDSNPVFRSLQTNFIGYFHWVQDKCGLVCIPHQRSVHGIELNREFIEKHTFRPSPLFKDHYITKDGKNPGNISIEDGNIVTAQGFPDKRKVKVISEELGYNKRSETFRILIIDRPLIGSVQLKKEDDGFLYDSQILLTHAESPLFLSRIPGSARALAFLNKEIETFCTNYMLLPDFLDDAAEKLRTIWKEATQLFLSCFDEKIPSDLKFVKGRIQLAVESHLLGSVNHKLFPKICEHCQPDDVEFEKNCQQLRQLTPSELGVPTSLQCDLSRACEKLATLDKCTCTFEKMISVKQVLDCITESVKETGDDALLTSDQYLPLLMNVIVNQKSLHIASNLYFLDKFQFYRRPSDSLSFSLVTFKAAFSYTQSFSSDLFNSSKQDDQEAEKIAEVSSSSPFQNSSSSSTLSSAKSNKTNREFDGPANQGFLLSADERNKFGRAAPGRNRNSAQGFEFGQAMQKASNPALGEFLSALKDDKRHVVYGKQT